MIYKNEHGTVDFWKYPQLNEHKKILINLSGGTDSALMTWMLCKKLTELDNNAEINFSILVDVERPTNLWNAREIILWYKERFDLNFGDEYVGEYKKGSIDNNFNKAFYHRKHTKKSRAASQATLLMHGRTANPPARIRRECNLNEGRQTVRDTPEEEFTGNTLQTYRPFIHVHKKWVAEEYKKNKIMDLFKLTASCIAEDYKTDFFTKPCKTCWWCREKHWAFGCYDFGYM